MLRWDVTSCWKIKSQCSQNYANSSKKEVNIHKDSVLILYLLPHLVLLFHLTILQSELPSPLIHLGQEKYTVCCINNFRGLSTKLFVHVSACLYILWINFEYTEDKFKISSNLKTMDVHCPLQICMCDSGYLLPVKNASRKIVWNWAKLSRSHET